MLKMKKTEGRKIRKFILWLAFSLFSFLVQRPQFFLQIEAQKKKLKDFTSFIEMVTKNDFRKLLEFVTVDYLVRTKQVRIAKKTDQINIPQETSENITKNIFILMIMNFH